jgi:hypothetical protein
MTSRLLDTDYIQFVLHTFIPNAQRKIPKGEYLKIPQGIFGYFKGYLRYFVTIGDFNPWKIPVNALTYLFIPRGIDRYICGIQRDGMVFASLSIPKNAEKYLDLPLKYLHIPMNIN